MFRVGTTDPHRGKNHVRSGDKEGLRYGWNSEQ